MSAIAAASRAVLLSDDRPTRRKPRCPGHHRQQRGVLPSGSRHNLAMSAGRGGSVAA